MSKPISCSQEELWNKNFNDRMQELGWTQRKFVAAYKEKYGTGSQADVSKWMHVGEIDSRTGKPRGFPSFETMRKIANLLGVSVGFLIGETKYKTFDLEKASKYTGLSSQAIEALCGITSGKSIPPFYKYSDDETTNALNLFLTSPSFVEYIKGIARLQKAAKSQKNPKNYFNQALDRIPKDLRRDVCELWSDAEEAINAKGVEPTPELWHYVEILDYAAGMDMDYEYILPQMVLSAKYALNETHIKIIEKIVPSDPTFLSNID